MDVERWAFSVLLMLTAIIVAAGGSRRMGFDKLFAPLLGKPVLAHALDAFESANSVDEIIIVAREDRHDEIEKLVREQGWKKIRAVVRGGEQRQDSVRAGLQSLTERTHYVAVHDAARPLVTPEQIERVFEQAQVDGAAALAEAVSDTLKRADVDLVVTESVDRHQLFAMQTPQIFERELIDEAYRAVATEKLNVTDEVSALQHIGRQVGLVPNEDCNFKITYERDLKLAELVLRERQERR